MRSVLEVKWLHYAVFATAVASCGDVSSRSDIKDLGVGPQKLIPEEGLCGEWFAPNLEKKVVTIICNEDASVKVVDYRSKSEKLNGILTSSTSITLRDPQGNKLAAQYYKQKRVLKFSDNVENWHKPFLNGERVDGVWYRNGRSHERIEIQQGTIAFIPGLQDPSKSEDAIHIESNKLMSGTCTGVFNNSGLWLDWTCLDKTTVRWVRFAPVHIAGIWHEDHESRARADCDNRAYSIAQDGASFTVDSNGEHLSGYFTNTHSFQIENQSGSVTLHSHSDWLSFYGRTLFRLCS